MSNKSESAPLVDGEHKQKLRDILFKAAGGISNNADEEIAAIEALFQPTAPPAPLVDGELRDELVQILTRNGKAHRIPELLENDLNKLEQLFDTHRQAAVREAEERTHRIYSKELDYHKKVAEQFIKREQLRLPGAILQIPGPGEAKYIEFSTPEDAEKAMKLLAAITGEEQQLNQGDQHAS